MNNNKLAILVSLSLAVSACATLDKSECQNADWQIIGLEDGSKGRAVTYIGNHRKACAEHGIKPNLDLYQIGHQAGLAQFCTAEVGFSRAKKGYSYNGVCPAHLRADFLYGYEKGRELYLLSKNIRQINGGIKNRETQLEAMQAEINELELKLISKAGSQTQRLAMLQDLKALQSAQAKLESEIHHLQLDAARLQGNYDVLNAQSTF